MTTNFGILPPAGTAAGWSSRLVGGALLLVAGCSAPAPSGPQPAAETTAKLAVVSQAESDPESAGAGEAVRGTPWEPLARGQLVDLTHPFDEQTIYWPTEEGFVLERGSNGVTAKGYYYAANRFRAAEHGGTHIDAPIHFFDQRHTVDQILLRTGWSRHWPDREKYLGTSERGAQAVAKLHFPGLAPEAARWLVEHRAPKAVGIDTASIDPGQSTLFESHVTLCEHNVPCFENLTGLDGLQAEGVFVMALPMKIAGGSGGPLRIVAWAEGMP
jgi:kynurenine formamidase